MNKIIKYNKLFEYTYDTPDNINMMLLNKIKNRFIKIFNDYDKKNKKSAKINLNKNIKRINSGRYQLEDMEISNYSKLYDYLIIYFYDDIYYYKMYISIEINNTDDIKNINKIDNNIKIKLKKYIFINNEFVGQIVKHVKMDDINAQLIKNLNDELDNFYEIKIK